MLENCAVMKRRIVCERSTTTLVGVMGLHRNSSMWPEMGKAGVQGSGVLRRTPRTAVLSEAQGWRGGCPWWKSWESIPQ